LAIGNASTTKNDKKLDEELISVCPDCGSTNLSDDKSEIVCNECGLVVEHDVVDPGPEWRAFDAEQRDKRGRVSLISALYFFQFKSLMQCCNSILQSIV